MEFLRIVGAIFSFFLIIFFAYLFIGELVGLVRQWIEGGNFCRHCGRRLQPRGWHDVLRCPNDCEYKLYMKREREKNRKK